MHSIDLCLVCLLIGKQEGLQVNSSAIIDPEGPRQVDRAVRRIVALLFLIVALGRLGCEQSLGLATKDFGD